MNETILDDKDKKFLKSVLVVVGLLSIVYLLLMSFSVIKVFNGDSCASEQINNFNNAVFFNSTYNITNSNSYELQRFNLNKGSYSEGYFCVGGFSANGNELKVVNGVYDSLGSLFVPSGSFYECGLINVDLLNVNSFIGFNCVDCSETNYLNVEREITGSEVLSVSNGVVSDSLPSNLVLKVGFDCTHRIKFLSSIYFSLIGFIVFLILLMLGFGKTREIITGGLE